MVNGPRISVRASFEGLLTDAFPLFRRCATRGFLFILLLSFTHAILAGEVVIETDRMSIERSPGIATIASPVSIMVSVPGCHFLDINEIQVDVQKRTVDLGLNPNEHGFLCTPPLTAEVLIEGLTEVGTYVVDVYQGPEFSAWPGFEPELKVGSFELAVAWDGVVIQPETPSEGSTQSGVGIIRGWACDAQRVEVRLDDGDPVQVSYGTSRADTQPACGDESNGYGMVFAWGLLGNGPHTMTTLVDGVEVSTVNFEVAGLDEPFVRGLSGTYELTDFPAAGESVSVRWSEADQNFIIVEYRK